jgi:hypothetical protein
LVVVVVVVWVLLVAAAAVLELVVVVVVVLAFCRVLLGLGFFRFAEVASRTGDSVALWLTRLVGFLPPRGKIALVLAFSAWFCLILPTRAAFSTRLSATACVALSAPSSGLPGQTVWPTIVSAPARPRIQ